jgi:hypothetical protein
MKYHLIDNNGYVVYTNTTSPILKYFEACTVENESFVTNGRKARHGKILSSWGITYLFTERIEFVERPRLFREQLRIYSEFLPNINIIKQEISEKVNKESLRLLHNLTSLNAHNIQEVYDFIPEDILRDNQGGRSKIVEDHIKANLAQATQTFLKIVKNNGAMKIEFSVFNKLKETNPKLDIQEHSIRKVILNTVHIFFQDFTDSGVTVKVSNSKEYINLDYESFQVALYYLIDNATKYILRDSIFYINFLKTENEFIVILDMVSMKIFPDEESKITMEGYSGNVPKKAKKAGKGIGMMMVEKLLPLNNAYLNTKINVDPLKNKTKKEIEFENNIFEIHFKTVMLMGTP